MASFSQGRTAAAQCGLFTYKSVPVIFEPPCIFQKHWGNQCGQAVPPIHQFIHHCQYWLNLHCHSHILQSSLELLQASWIPMSCRCLTRHWRCFIFLLLLWEHSNLFFTTRSALGDYSIFVSHDKLWPGPLVACSWCRLPVRSIGAYFNARPSLLWATQSIHRSTVLFWHVIYLMKGTSHSLNKLPVLHTLSDHLYLYG